MALTAGQMAIAIGEQVWVKVGEWEVKCAVADVRQCWDRVDLRVLPCGEVLGEAQWVSVARCRWHGVGGSWRRVVEAQCAQCGQAKHDEGRRLCVGCRREAGWAAAHGLRVGA